jgi:hypothetical protein
VAAEIAALGHPLDLILCERPASDRTRASTRLSSRAAGTDGCTPPQPTVPYFVLLSGTLLPLPRYCHESGGFARIPETCVVNRSAWKLMIIWALLPEVSRRHQLRNLR